MAQDRSYFINTYAAAVEKMVADKAVRLELPKDFIKQWTAYEAKNPRLVVYVESDLEKRARKHRVDPVLGLTTEPSSDR